VDIFRAAWQLNHALPQNAPPFRIFALNDSPDWSFIKSQEDRDNGEIMKKVWKGGGEDLWAKVILEEVVAKGRKTLVYCGIHHAFTEYKQPIYDEVQKKFVRFEDTRAGNYIYNEIGKKAITIYLNAPWPSAEGYDKSYVLPADGFIEASLRDLPAESCRVGFDTKGTPFGTLTGETSIYKYGYQNFTLDKFCDGYIYQIPISQYQGVTPLPDFINTKNINYARKQSPNPWFRNASVEDFNEAIEQDANITKRFEHLRKK
jgi:hypothetical protein